jgi:hypothetical protein
MTSLAVAELLVPGFRGAPETGALRTAHEDQVVLTGHDGRIMCAACGTAGHPKALLPAIC